MYRQLSLSNLPKMFAQTKYIMFVCLFVVSCSSLNKKVITSDLSPSQFKDFEQAIIYIKEKNFLKAAEIYDNLSRQVKGESMEAVLLFNAGSTYMKLGDCERAIARYRRAIERSLKQPQLKTRGLMEISYSYECSGDLKASYLSLRDAGDLRIQLPLEIRRMVYPARLSIAYAWRGQKPKAENYKSFALTGVLQNKMHYSSSKELESNLSRVFYLMGKSYTSTENLKDRSFVRSFSYHQFYLLQSIFLNNKDWSHRSKKEMSLLFDKLVYVFARSSFQDKNKYKIEISKAIKESQILIKREKLDQIESFYNKQFLKIKKFLE